VLRNQNESLEREVKRRTEQLVEIQNVTIEVMSSLAETRDSETGFHIRRVQHYVKKLGELLITHPDFEDQIDQDTVDWYFKSAPLHDIGKIGIPDMILLKPGSFEPEELEIMKQHTVIGRDIIVTAEQRLGKAVPFLHFAKEFAYSHHEKWDGTGYPEGLKAEDIPLGARILAIADVFDALISARVYKHPFTYIQAFDILEKGRGSHFDPTILDVFLDNKKTFIDIADAYRD